MEPDERQDSKLADVQTELETTTEPTTSVVKAEPTTLQTEGSNLCQLRLYIIHCL